MGTIKERLHEAIEERLLEALSGEVEASCLDESNHLWVRLPARHLAEQIGASEKSVLIQLEALMRDGYFIRCKPAITSGSYWYSWAQPPKTGAWWMTLKEDALRDFRARYAGNQSSEAVSPQRILVPIEGEEDGVFERLDPNNPEHQEDLRLAQEASARWHAEGCPTISWDEVKRELGLDD